MVDLQNFLNKQKEEKTNSQNTGQKVSFNFTSDKKKEDNSLADSGSTPAPVLQDSGEQAETTGPVKFSFSKSGNAGLLSMAEENENAPPVKTGGDDGNSSENETSQTVPVSLEEIGAQQADDFSFKDQPEKYPEEAAEKLQGALDLLANSIDNKDLVAQGVSIVMKTVQDYPFLKDNLRPEDFGLMVRGLRESYGIVVAKKSANKSKRAKNEKKVDEAVSFLTDLGIGKDLGNLV